MVIRWTSKVEKVTKFEVGQHVPLQHPHKLSGLYRGQMKIFPIDRPDIIKVRDLTTDKVSSVSSYQSGTTFQAPN